MLRIYNESYKNSFCLRQSDYNWDYVLKAIKIHLASGRVTTIDIFNNYLLSSILIINIYPILGGMTKIEILNYCLLSEFSMKAIIKAI